MSIKGQGHSLTSVKGHSDFKVKCLTFGLYIQTSDSGPRGAFVYMYDFIATEGLREDWFTQHHRIDRPVNPI